MIDLDPQYCLEIGEDKTLIGVSGHMQGVFRQIREFASQSHPVLISGETGTGKSLVAMTIHHATNRELYFALDPFEVESFMKNKSHLTDGKPTTIFINNVENTVRGSPDTTSTFTVKG